MSGLRDEIRAILREEIAVLEVGGQIGVPSIREEVQITTNADLNQFVLNIAHRASEPGFVEDLERGGISFELASPILAGGTVVNALEKPTVNFLDKKIVTERDIIVLGSARVLRVAKTSRFTPLALDEVRRRRIRIERSEA
jgi:hypothetical protein